MERPQDVASAVQDLRITGTQPQCTIERIKGLRLAAEMGQRNPSPRVSVGMGRLSAQDPVKVCESRFVSPELQQRCCKPLAGLGIFGLQSQGALEAVNRLLIAIQARECMSQIR